MAGARGPAGRAARRLARAGAAAGRGRGPARRRWREAALEQGAPAVPLAGGRRDPGRPADARPTWRCCSEDIFAPWLALVPVADTTARSPRPRLPLRARRRDLRPRAGRARLRGAGAAGSVCINDVIVPTADPRLPFGGRGRSGFGVTRGAEGLLEMTVVKTISIRRRGFLPHLAPSRAGDAARIAGMIRVLHGGLRRPPPH